MVKASLQITIDQLQSLIKQKYSETQELILVYKDTTGDSITLSSQDELEYSIEDFATINQASKKMEVFVTVKESTTEAKVEAKQEVKHQEPLLGLSN